MEAGTGPRHPWETARVEFVSDLVARCAPLEPGSVVIDVGCGDTFVAERLAARHPHTTFYAVDAAFTDDLIAKFRAELAGTNVCPHRSLDSLPSIGREVSLVLLMDVLEHIEDTSAFLRGLADRPFMTGRTRFLITVPSYQALFSSHDEFLGHYRRYSTRLLKQHVEAAGLTVQEHGDFFLSLLPLRLMQVIRERLAGPASPRSTTGLVTWRGSAGMAAAMHRALVLDVGASRALRRFGVSLPGLSKFAVCRKSV